METKVCTICKVEKDVSDFTKRYDRPIGVRPNCKECQRVIDAKRRGTEKGKEKYRNKNWKKQGIDIDYQQYKVMYEDVKGCCQICSEQYPVLCVDHNHATGEIRGLLCTACNLALENFKESVNVMKNGISYLERFGER